MKDFQCGMQIEWKKIASMENGNIVSILFHTMPWHQVSKAHHKMLKALPPAKPV